MAGSDARQREYLQSLVMFAALITKTGSEGSNSYLGYTRRGCHCVCAILWIPDGTKHPSHLSALPFAPSSSMIGKLYSRRFPRIVDVERGRLRQWPALVMAISVPNKAQVVCVAWSWNDEHVAAGLYDGKVCVWNGSTGTKISELLAAGRERAHGWGCMLYSQKRDRFRHTRKAIQ